MSNPSTGSHPDGSRRVLIVGYDSTIGSALGQALRRRGVDVLGTSRRIEAAAGDLYPLDLGVEKIDLENVPGNIEMVVMAAGITREQDCQANPALARRVNVENTMLLLDHYAKRGSRLVFLSTNLVLAGNIPAAAADTVQMPLGLYGSQKAEVERWLLALDAEAAICRLGKVLLPAMPLLQRWQDDFRAGNGVTVFHDYYLSPVTLEFTVNTLVHVLLDGGGGIYQMTGGETVSYAQLALAVAKALGFEKSQVIAASWRDIGGVSFSPRYTHLDGSRIRSEFGIELPSADDAIGALFTPRH